VATLSPKTNGAANQDRSRRPRQGAYRTAPGGRPRSGVGHNGLIVKCAEARPNVSRMLMATRPGMLSPLNGQRCFFAFKNCELRPRQII
jgi:hypothetical protein